LWDYLERTRVNREAYASIWRIKYMLEGQYVEICPQMIRHRNALSACIGRLSKPGNFQERWVSHA